MIFCQFSEKKIFFASYAVLRYRNESLYSITIFFSSFHIFCCILKIWKRLFLLFIFHYNSFSSHSSTLHLFSLSICLFISFDLPLHLFFLHLIVHLYCFETCINHCISNKHLIYINNIHLSVHTSRVY